MAGRLHTFTASLLFCAAAAIPAGPAGVAPVLLPWPLERVVDGDTVGAGGYRVRLYGLNAPEIRGICAEEKALGRRAAARLAALIAGAGRVELQRAPPGKFSQLQARLVLDGRDAAGILIAEGLARPYFGGPKEGWCGSRGEERSDRETTRPRAPDLTPGVQSCTAPASTRRSRGVTGRGQPKKTKKGRSREGTALSSQGGVAPEVGDHPFRRRLSAVLADL